MKRGIYVPNFGQLGNVRLLAELARETEIAGYEGFFIFDHLLPTYWPEGQPKRIVDVQVALTAIALATSRIKFGALVTPLARRRPVKFARESVTLDQLSNGRLVVGAGLGFDAETEFADLGEDPDPRVRADRLDEALSIVDRLWRWDPTPFDGTYVSIRAVQFLERPVQSPRIPIWCAAEVMIPNRRRALRRAARWDGVILARLDRTVTPSEVADVRRYVASHRESDGPFDLVVFASDLPSEAALLEYADAGVTWWLHTPWTVEALRAVLPRDQEGAP
jgi:alkanesulfonate monooxygenase SsuD/methylene tetrahydromethanopterin reductase-like flavin-dependent oxidoreductase (luciferase family)